MIVDSISEISAPPTFYRLRDLLPNVSVHVKLESLNVAGSIKLKTARRLIRDLETNGRLQPGCRVIESSSGNLGVALAFLCAERGYEFTCISDPNISPQTCRLIQAIGAKVIIVREKDARGGYLQTRLALIQRMISADPRLVWTNQYANRANSAAHYSTTGAEILGTFPTPDWVFIGAGTTGTLAGCSRFLREHSPKTRIVAVDSVGSVTFGGPSGPRHLPGMGTSLRPALADDCLIDELLMVGERDAARLCRDIAKRQGLFLGPSSGSVLSAVVSLRARITAGQTVVAISPDAGDRYLETLYNDEWLESRFPGLAIPNEITAAAASA